MRCLHCGKRIGLLRGLQDRQFCSEDHRLRAKRMYSARMARGSSVDYEDGWVVTASEIQASEKKSSASFGVGSGALLVVITLALTLLLPHAGQDGSIKSPISYLPPTAGLGDRLTRALPFKGSIKLREEFSADLRDWQSANPSMDSDGARVQDWVVRAGAIYPSALKLWKPTLTLGDYQMKFQTRIESKAVGWAFRAQDDQNFYGTKLIVSRSKDSLRAEIARWAMVGGHTVAKVQLPIPINIQPSKAYDVQVTVHGDKFTTLVNGQLVDAWNDRRLKRGGVGFFADNGERAALDWVSITERDSLLGGFLNFGLIVPPQILY